MRHTLAVTLLALAGCSGGGDTPAGPSAAPVAPPTAAPVGQSATLTIPLAATGVAIALPPSNGYACTLVVPPNDAPAGATLLVTMPATGAIPQAPPSGSAAANVPATSASPAPSVAPVTVLPSAPVTFARSLAPTCAPAAPTPVPYLSQYVDPSDPVLFLLPTVSATNGSETLATGGGAYAVAFL